MSNLSVFSEREQAGRGPAESTRENLARSTGDSSRSENTRWLSFLTPEKQVKALKEALKK